jgi:uncharacterized membrane protein YfcA
MQSLVPLSTTDAGTSVAEITHGSLARVEGRGRARRAAALGRLGVPIGLALAILAAGYWRWHEDAHPWRGLAIMAAVAASAGVSSIVGFAFSAIAGTALYLLVDAPVEAVKIMLWCSIAIQVYSVARLWRHVEPARVMPFLAGGLATVGPACWMVLRLSAELYLAGIGALLAAYGVAMSLRRPLVIRAGPRLGLALDVVTGALGGITGPVAAFPGAGVTVWCSLRGWDKLRQRAIYQPYILLMQIAALATMTALGGGGRFQPLVALYAVPAVLGCHLGLLLFERLSNRQFNHMIHALLIVSGLSMVLKVACG